MADQKSTVLNTAPMFSSKCPPGHKTGVGSPIAELSRVETTNDQYSGNTETNATAQSVPDARGSTRRRAIVWVMSLHRTNEPAHQTDIDQRENYTDEEHDPRDRGRVARVESTHPFLVQIHDDGLELAVVAAGSAHARRVEQLRLGEQLKPANGRGDHRKLQRRPDGRHGDRPEHPPP